MWTFSKLLISWLQHGDWSTQLVFEIVTLDRNGDDISVVLCHSPKNVADIYEFSLVVEVVLINPTLRWACMLFKSNRLEEPRSAQQISSLKLPS
jgi:hypothetical protein